MDQDSAHMVTASKVPMLKPGEYEIWRMRIEQYIQMIDYALWEVIENGATLPKTKIVEGVMTEMPITTAEEKAQRRLERLVGKANYKTRKTQRNLLKQQYENFTASSTKMLDQLLIASNKLVITVGAYWRLNKRAFTTVLTKSDLVLVNTARQVNAAYSKTTVNVDRPISYLSKTAHSTVKRPIHKNTTFKNSNIKRPIHNTARDKNFNTARPKAVVNAVKGNNFNAVKASACWVWKLDQGVIDSGCSRHMTGNMSYLTDYEEIDGGYVAFGGNPKGGKITGKGTIKTGNLDFKNVYFVRELKFNLFSVSQMYDKKE
ncbi:hypothetical protein Tco_0606489 [Tanacetum coccineum]